MRWKGRNSDITRRMHLAGLLFFAFIIEALISFFFHCSCSLETHFMLCGHKLTLSLTVYLFVSFFFLLQKTQHKQRQIEYRLVISAFLYMKKLAANLTLLNSCDSKCSCFTTTPIGRHPSFFRKLNLSFI